MKGRKGFTIIELLLVVGLVLTLGAMAAPQFTDVLDHSKDKADIAQMDQILAAFQMQQGMAFDSHTGHYDMANPKFIDYQSDDEGKRTAVLQSKAAEKALETFLEDALTNPGSAVYMEGVKSARDGKTPTKDDLIYEVAASSTHVWLTHKIAFGADLESSVKVRIPGIEVIENPYSDEALLDGTWMIVGDDDRLRADYVKDLMYHVREDHGEEDGYKDFVNKVNQEHEYRYRTTFKIDGDKEESFGPGWIIWAPKDSNGVPFTGIKLGNVPDGISVEYEYSNKVNKSNMNGRKSLLTRSDYLKVNNGNGKYEVIKFYFKKNGHEIHTRTYKLELVPIGVVENGADEGYIHVKDNGNPHHFHYKLTNKTGDEIVAGASLIHMSFNYHAGFVFNMNNDNNGKYNNYDCLLFEEDEDGDMALRSYRVNGGSAELETSEKLNGFRFGQAYEMEVTVKQDRVKVSLSQNLLNSNEVEFSSSHDVYPGIGFYMNDEVELNSKPAVTIDVLQIPMVTYENGGDTGPQLVLLGMPEFYPYQKNNTEDDSLVNEQKVSIEILGITPKGPTTEPVEIDLNADTGKNMGLLNWEIGDQSGNKSVNGTERIRVSSNGRLVVSLFANNKQVYDEVEIANIIESIDSRVELTELIDGKYQFDFLNSNTVIDTISQANPEDVKYRIYLESGGEQVDFVNTGKNVIRTSLIIQKDEINVDDMKVIIVTSENEVLGITSISGPSQILNPPEVSFVQKVGFNSAQFSLDSNVSGGVLSYKLFNSEKNPICEWKLFNGSAIESFYYLKAQIKSEGKVKETDFVKNPYLAIPSAPKIVAYPEANNNILKLQAEQADLWIQIKREHRDWETIANGTAEVRIDYGELIFYRAYDGKLLSSEEIEYKREVPNPTIRDEGSNKIIETIPGVNVTYTYEVKIGKGSNAQWKLRQNMINSGSEGIIIVGKKQDVRNIIIVSFE